MLHLTTSGRPDRKDTCARLIRWLAPAFRFRVVRSRTAPPSGTCQTRSQEEKRSKEETTLSYASMKSGSMS